MANFKIDMRPKASRNREGFDLSRKSVFSCKAGGIYPILNLPVVPNSHYEIRPSDFVRTFPLKSDAFLRAKQEIVYFFLPYQSIWRGFNDWYSQRGTQVTSYSHNATYHPRFNLGELLWRYTYLYPTNVEMVEEGLRLLDLLGYGNYRELVMAHVGSGSSADVKKEALSYYFDKYLNPFAICAFNRYWYDFVRNKNFDLNIQPQLFNLDYLDTSTLQGSIIPPTTVIDMFRSRRINWKRDKFMSMFPTQQFGDVSVVSGSVDSASKSGASPLYVDSSGKVKLGTLRATSTFGPFFAPGDAADPPVDANLASSFDIMALRRAEAVQRWRENMLRAGQGNDNQFEARFGDKPKYSFDGEPVILGSVDGSLLMNGVTQTSAGDSTQPLGDVAGQGTSTLQDRTIKFDSQGDFGVIIGLMYVRPEAEYDSTLIDKHNMLLEREEYFNPELQNLGLESVYGAELTNYGTTSPSALETYGANLNATLGYSARYLCYKTAVDKVFGSFASRYGVVTALGKYVPGPNNDWVVPRSDLSAITDALSTANFYVSPSVFNSVFYAEAGNTQDSDHFLINLYQDIKAIQPMSKVGLPY